MVQKVLDYFAAGQRRRSERDYFAGEPIFEISIQQIEKYNERFSVAHEHLHCIHLLANIECIDSFGKLDSSSNS